MKIELVTPGKQCVATAQTIITACEQCNPETAQIPFDWILDEITGLGGTAIDYFMLEPATCPNCGSNVFEKTLVEIKSIS